eukprot:2297654-Pleurochrysis_carterae.AAC.1
MSPFASRNLQTCSVPFAARENTECRFVSEGFAYRARQEARAVVRGRPASRRWRRPPRFDSGRKRGEAVGHVTSRASTISVRCVMPARRAAGSHRAGLA